MANGDDQNQGNQNQGRGRRGDRQERRSESQFTSEDLNELTTSIYFLESTLNEAVDKAENVSDQLSETLFDQAFMNSLNQNLDQLGSATSRLADQMESRSNETSSDQLSPLTSNINTLGNQISKLASVIENMELESRAGTVPSSEMGETIATAVAGAISTQVPSALQNIFANRGRRFNRRRQQTGGEGTGFDFDFSGGSFGRFANIGEIIAGAKAEFPDFVSKINLTQEAIAGLAGKTQISFQDVFEAMTTGVMESRGELQNFVEQGIESGLIEKIDELKGYDLADILTGNLTSEMGEYEDVVTLLATNFREAFGDQTTEVLSLLQGTRDKAQKMIQDVKIDPDLFGHEKVFQTISDDAEELQSFLIESFSRFDLEESGEEAEILSGSMASMLKMYKKMDSEGASILATNEAMNNMAKSVKEQYKEQREENEEFAEVQDRVLETMQEKLLSAKRLESHIEAQNEQLNRFKRQADNAVESFYGIVGSASAALNIFKSWRAALGLAVAAAYAIWDGMLELDSATQQVAEATGLIPTRLQEAQTVISDIGGPLMARGQDMNEIAGVVTAIYDNFQSLEIAAERFGVTGENVTDQTTRLATVVGTVATSLNVSNDEAAQMIGTMQALTSTTGKQLEDQLVIAKTLADQAELAPKAVFQDISEASEQIAKFGAVTGEEIARAAVEARSFGSNLQEVLNIAEGLRGDITGAITGLQRAELMLGQPIDELKLLRASFQGPEASAKALRETITSLDLDLDGPLAAIQLEPLAETLGISIARMREMQETSRAARKSIGDLVVAGNLAALEEKFSDSQSAIQKFQNSVQSAFFTLKQMIAGPVLEFANPYLREFGRVIQDLNEWLSGSEPTLESVADKLNTLGSEGDETRKRTAGFAASVVELAIYLRDSLPDIKAFGMAMIEAGKGIAKVFTALAPVLEFFGDTLSWVFSGEWYEVAAKIGGVTVALIGMKKALGFLMGNISSLFTFGKAAETASDAAKVTQNPFNTFGAQLLMVAGSLYVAAEAFETFNDVEWSSLVKGGGALAIMGGALKGFDAVLTSIKWPQLLAAGAVMVAFSHSLDVISNALQKFEQASAEGALMMATVGTAVMAMAGVLTTVVGGTGGAAALAGFAAGGVMYLFASSLMLVGKSMKMFGEASNSIVTAASRISRLENVDEIAMKIVMLSEALDNLPDASFTDFLAGLVGEGVSDKLQSISDLAKHGEKLKMVPDYIRDMSEGLEGFEVPDDLEDTFDEIGDAIRELPSDTWFSENIITSLHGLIENSDKFEQLKQNITGIGSAAEEIKPIDPDVVSNFTQQVSSMASVVSQVRTAGEGSGMFSQDIGDTISPLNELAGKADSMKSVAGSLESIAQSIQRISNIDLGQSIDQIQRLGNATTSRIMGQIDVMARRNQAETTPEPNQQNATITPEPTESAATIEESMVQTEQPSIDENYKDKTLQNDQQVIEQLNQMIDLQRNLVTSLQNGDIAVYLDGREVTDQLLRSSKKQNARG